MARAPRNTSVMSACRVERSRTPAPQGRTRSALGLLLLFTLSAGPGCNAEPEQSLQSSGRLDAGTAPNPSSEGNSSEVSEDTTPHDASVPTAAPEQQLKPIASIRFATEVPSENSVYPFSATLAAPSLAMGTTLYLSAAESTDPEGLPLQYQWTALKPSGEAIALGASAEESSTELLLSQFGKYTVTLEVTRSADPEATATLALVVHATERYCASNGVSAPCSDSLAVTGGTFLLGSPASEGDPAEQPEHRATIANFELDRFEVTVGRFRAYFESQVGTPPDEGAAA